MMSWFTLLATHSGSYGEGPVGLPAAHVLATSLFLLWQEEPPFFWFLGLYVALLILLFFFRAQGARSGFKLGTRLGACFWQASSP